MGPVVAGAGSAGAVELAVLEHGMEKHQWE